MTWHIITSNGVRLSTYFAANGNAMPTRQPSWHTAYPRHFRGKPQSPACQAKATLLQIVHPFLHPFLHPFPTAFISSGFQGLLVIFLHLSLFCCILALLLPSEEPRALKALQVGFSMMFRPCGLSCDQALWVLKCFIGLQCYGPLRSKSPTFLAASQSHPHHSSRGKWM